MMSFETFRKIYDDIRPENINVSGLGEPFLNPEIFEIIRYAKSQGSIVNCASNFTKVSGKEEKIVENGCVFSGRSIVYLHERGRQRCHASSGAY